jgi:hypothetical protein
VPLKRAAAFQKQPESCRLLSPPAGPRLATAAAVVAAEAAAALLLLLLLAVLMLLLMPCYCWCCDACAAWSC